MLFSFPRLQKIINNQWPMINTSQGFTLVEMLAVIIVFIFVGGIMLSILVTSLRTSSKTDTLSAVRENGNYVITQMSKTIRDARGLVSPFPCVTPTTVSSITILDTDQDQITYTCSILPTPTPGSIASNSASMIDTSVVSVSDCSFTCMQDSESQLPIIQINFSLKQNNTSKFAEKTISNVSFQTSVVMRNITR